MEAPRTNEPSTSPMIYQEPMPSETLMENLAGSDLPEQRAYKTRWAIKDWKRDIVEDVNKVKFVFWSLQAGIGLMSARIRSPIVSKMKWRTNTSLKGLPYGKGRRKELEK